MKFGVRRYATPLGATTWAHQVVRDAKDEVCHRPVGELWRDVVTLGLGLVARDHHHRLAGTAGDAGIAVASSAVVVVVVIVTVVVVAVPAAPSITGATDEL